MADDTNRMLEEYLGRRLRPTRRPRPAWGLAAGIIVGAIALLLLGGAIATVYQGTGNIDMQGSKVINSPDPTSDAGLVTKNYADALNSSINFQYGTCQTPGCNISLNCSPGTVYFDGSADGFNPGICPACPLATDVYPMYTWYGSSQMNLTDPCNCANNSHVMRVYALCAK